jgi:hypothetical protein
VGCEETSSKRFNVALGWVCVEPSQRIADKRDDRNRDRSERDVERKSARAAAGV